MTKMHSRPRTRRARPTPAPAPGAKLWLDEVDCLILREMIRGERTLFQSERVSVEAIARRLGVHRNTVAARARRMLRAGAFLPLTLTFDPYRFGIFRGALWVTPAMERRDEATVDALFLVEGVQYIVQFLEGWVVFIYGEDPATVRARGDLVSHLCGGSSPLTWESLSWEDYAEHTPLKVTKTDVAIIRSLLANARLPFPRVAKAIGVSTKTVQRRFDALANAGAIMVLPSGTGGFSGMFFGHLRVLFGPEAEGRARARERVDALLPRTVFRNLAHRRFGSWIVFVRTVAELEDVVARVRRVPGVTGVGMRLLLGYRVSPRFGDWLVRALERRLGTPLTS